MIVCLCRGVSYRAIRAALEVGAETVEAVAAACGAGTSCGGCVPMIEAMCRHSCETTREREAAPTSQAA